jgi:hypothetical protein
MNFFSDYFHSEINKIIDTITNIRRFVLCLKVKRVALKSEDRNFIDFISSLTP